ncbi:MAG: histidine kinase [Saprospiraceae bacterium]|nr:histidine kinase [Saprospiraceae bacterium]
MKNQSLLSNNFFWRIAFVSAFAVGMVFSVSTQFRLGFQAGVFGREWAFGFLFTLAVWWYNLEGFRVVESWFFFRFKGGNWSRLLRVLSTLIFSFIVVWLDERAQFLHIDEDLSGYVQPEFANEFRGLVTAGIMLLIFFFLETVRKYFQTRMQVEQLKLENSIAQFEMLKQQVNPHFLFNSLNILKTMVKNRDAGSEEYIIRLSELYRNLLLNNRKEKATLEEELAVLENYVYMLKARFEDKLVINNALKPGNKVCYLPPLTLQMLVENCIKHNIVSAEKPLVIDLFEANNRIVVRNNLQMKRSVDSSNRLGLDNINQRYRVLAGSDIDIEKTPDYFTVRLPVINH